jgi:hydroxymethylpyrimidine/phosphomethylpyrimidine kinase
MNPANQLPPIHGTRNAFSSEIACRYVNPKRVAEIVATAFRQRFGSELAGH